MKVLGEESWSWMLFDDDGELVLSVVCGGVGVYDVTFQLSEGELRQVQKTGSEATVALARAVSAGAENYVPRHLADFHCRADVEAAIATWRSMSHSRPDNASA